MEESTDDISVYKWTVDMVQKINKGMKDTISAPYASRARMSRRSVTPPYVTAKPDVMHHTLEEGDRFMVLATDGLWERMDNEEVVEYVGNYFREKICPGVEGANAATAITRHSLVAQYPPEKREEALQYIFSIPAPYCRNIRDDITVTVIFFDQVACPGFQAKRLLPVISTVDSDSWRDFVEKEIAKTASKL